jgi:hypothetical protein
MRHNADFGLIQTIDKGDNKMAVRKPKLVLFIMGIVAVLTVIAFSIQPSFSQSNSAQLKGSWMGTVTFQDPAGFESFIDLMTFTPGGGVVESRRLYVPKLPVGSILETTGHGEWVKTGNRKFEAKLMFPLQGAPNNPNSNGTYLGTGNVRLKLQLNEAGTELDGTFASEIRDPAGKVALTGSGGFHATPIRISS